MEALHFYDNIIDGQMVGSDPRKENINPSDISDVIGLYAIGSTSDVDSAIDVARRAQSKWAGVSSSQRSRVLSTAARLIEERVDKLADLLAREEGKPIGEARAEVLRASQLLMFFSGEALRNSGQLIESIRPGLQARLTHEPVGVVGVITPWNFPIAIPAWKIAPALAFGNAVVFKPADLTPGSAWALVSLLHEAGLPAGVLNLVMGRGSIVGQAMVEHAGISAVSFTGSQPVGVGLAETAARSGKRIQCEMGGKNPLLVLSDADLDNAVECAVNGAFFSTGQRCTASSRLIVTADIHDEFVDRLHARMSSLVVGDARNPQTTVGPVVDESQLKNNLGYLEIAKAEISATGDGEILGGQQVEVSSASGRLLEGFYLTPALIVGATNDMRSSREEIFGPVASVIRVSDYAEALFVANDTEFGLSAGICTRNLSVAEHFQRHSDAGMVMVNTPTAGVDPHVSFGGRKASSYGYREQGEAAREFFTLHKTSYVNPL